MIRRTIIGALTLLLLPTTNVSGQEGLRQGWWTVDRSGDVLPTPISGADVPEDGLLVQGGPDADAPWAIAAIAVPVPDGADVRSVVVHATSSLAVAPGSELFACPLSSSGFTATQGGPIEDAPARDCQDAESAPVGADGRTFSFPADALITEDALAMALVPATPTTRVVLERPGDDLLGIARPTTPPSPRDPSADVGTVTSTSAPAPQPSPTASSSPAISTGPAPFDTPVVEAAPSATSPATDPVPATTSFVNGFAPLKPPDTQPAAVVALIGAVAAIAYAWGSSARRPNFGGITTANATPSSPASTSGQQQVAPESACDPPA